MNRKPATRSSAEVERQIARLASRQQGNVTREQLLALGLGEEAIKYRVRIGRLIPLYRGVYAVSGAPLTPLGRAAAAVLACGPDAALSHASAAVLWKMGKYWPSAPEVTVKTARARPGIQLHRSIVLTNADVRTYERIRITSPARTLLDIAPRLDDDELARALSDSSAARHLYLDALRNLLRRSRGVPGAARLAVLVGDYAPTRSEFEDGFRRFVRSHQLPEPQMNVKVAGYLVDALFAPERVIVELDGYDYHRDPGAFERDRKRDTVTLAAGYETARLTWTRMINTPHPEAELLHAILAARREGFRPVGGAVRRDRP